VKPWGIDVSVIYPGGVVTEFTDHAGINRKTNARTPRFMVLSAEQVADAVIKSTRHPRRMMIIPWLWSITVFINKFFPDFVDYTTMKRFTIPEREDELKTK
jgi:short-subunit dehydrogenase